MIRVQYRLENGEEIRTMWVPLETEVGHVRREMLRRHLGYDIPRLCVDGVTLEDSEAVMDWKTTTGTRFQVTASIDVTLKEDEGRNLSRENPPGIEEELQNEGSDQSSPSKNQTKTRRERVTKRLQRQRRMMRYEMTEIPCRIIG
jgi:hypothetical protein